MKTHKIAWVMLASALCSVCLSCNRTNARHAERSEPLHIEEPTVTEHPARDRCEEVDASTAAEIPWLKPGHTLVVHTAKEARRAKREEPCCDDRRPWDDVGGARIIDGDALQQLRFPRKSSLLLRSRVEVTELVIELAQSDDTYFQGIYLPPIITSDHSEVLHLFECPSGELSRYRAHDFYVVCNPNIPFIIEIPAQSEGGEWAFCEFHRSIRRFAMTTFSEEAIARIPIPDDCSAVMDSPTFGWEGVAIFTDNAGKIADSEAIVFVVEPSDFSPVERGYLPDDLSEKTARVFSLHIEGVVEP